MDIIALRRSIRKYTDRRLSRDEIDQILLAGMSAPSAMNQRPWRFVVVTEPETLKTLAGMKQHAQMLLHAPAAFVVCADTANLPAPAMWVQDCAACTENMLLKITELGLGGVWLGTYPKLEQVAFVRDTLGIPVGVEPFAVIACGEPDESRPDVDRFHPDFVHQERW
jgi:nitroreductase